MMARHQSIDVLLRIAAIGGLIALVLLATRLASARDIPNANGTHSAKNLALSSPLSLSWSPDGKKIAVGEMQGGQIYTVDFQNSTPLELAGDEQELRAQEIRSIAWSPDGRILAGAVDDNIWLWDGNTGKKIAILRGIIPSPDEEHTIKHLGATSESW